MPRNGKVMIDYLIHYYRKGSEPFQSLSTLSEIDAVELMSFLYIQGAIFWERFKHPAEYLRRRREIENTMHQEFISKGGNPQLRFPIYMVLGRSKWALEVVDESTLETTVEKEIPLSIFNESDISFTYPDSMVSYMFAKQKDPKFYQSDYHGKIFTLPEIVKIINANGMPGEEWKTNMPENLANYIEAQVWNKKPLLEFI
jgi:hypothetical protein